jgi:type I restriction enzyme S subunit
MSQAVTSKDDVLVIPQGYKQTEVGVIPEDWDVKLISDAFEICNPLRLPLSAKVRESMKGEYPYYGPTKIQDYINEYRLDGEYALIGEDGDHFLKFELFPQTQLARGKFNVNNHAHVIKGKIASAEWFYQFFKHRDITFHLLRQGAGRYKLNKATLESIPCAIPSKTEQTAIANALSDVDELLSELEKFIVKKQEIKTATMQQLLTGKTRLPAFSTYDESAPEGKSKGQRKCTKPSKLGEIPEDWEVKKLKQMLEDNRIPSGLYKDKKFYGTGTAIIKLGDVFKNDSFKPDIVQRVETTNLENKAYSVNIGDLVIALASVKLEGVGKVMLVNELTEPTLYDHNVALIRFKKGYSPKFMSFVFKSNYVRTLIASRATQVGTTFLKTSTILEFPIALPSPEEQTAIANILSDMDEEIQELKQRLTKTRQIKQGMMQELLTGKTRLPFDKADEQALKGLEA